MENTCKIAEVGLIGMLHEMNNPLTNIKLCLELLESAPAHLREVYYSIIKKSADVMESSIKDIYSSFVENGFSLHMEPEYPFSIT